MTDSLLLVVMGMGAVTYIPRMLPLVMLKNIKLPPYINSFLRFIPVSALSALIFPGALYSTGSVESAAAGCAVSIGLALTRVNIMLVVLGGIAGALAWEMLM